MKKLLGAIICACALVFCLAGCQVQPLEFSENKVAMVTDYGDITDQSFNQATYEGCSEFCLQNNVAFRYYKPASNTDADRVKSIKTAISEGYNIIVMPGYAFAPAIAEVAVEKLYANVKFVALDVSEYDLTTALEAQGSSTEIPANVWSAVYQEELCGFFAGYAAVKAGYKKLGFLGGMAVPAVVRYGLGFVQGVKAAAKEDQLTDVSVEYVYGGQFFGDADITAVMDTWYGPAKGVEIVFACGGGIYSSACEAAQKLTNGGAVIGVDVDQRGTIEAAYNKVNCLTSAMKGLAATVKSVLGGIIKDNSFNGGHIVTLGLVSATDVEKNYVGIPTATASWKFGTSFTVDQYKALVAKVMDGTIVVSADISVVPASSTEVTVNYTAKSIK